MSVQLPSRGRAGVLARCVGALSAQTLADDEFEVIVGLDGEDSEAERMARSAWVGRPARNLRVLTFPRQGHLPIRSAMVGMTEAPLLVFMNDDVIGEAGFLAAHVAAHEEAVRVGVGRGDVPCVRLAEPRLTPAPHAGEGVMVVGATPWAVGEADTLFDRLVRETGLVFFYDAMEREAREGGAAARWRDWGFRHFWTLNASVPRRAVEAVGGFRAIRDTYGHEDLELAFRLKERLGMRVVYRPEARGVHEHRYMPGDVMRREVNLGSASWRFARVSPEFGLALFGRDVTSEEEVAYSRAFVERERATAERLAADFEALAGMEAESVSAGVLPILSRQFLLLKRHLWRRGLLEAMEMDARGEVREGGRVCAGAGHA